MNETVKEKFRPLLQEAGLKTTSDRLSILNALSKSKKPLSVKELKEKLDKENVDQATIYRTIESLLSNNVIRTVNFEHDHNHYELINSIHHHHVICEKCDKVVDMTKCDTSKLEQEVKKNSGFAKINHHALEFFGLCKACADK